MSGFAMIYSQILTAFFGVFIAGYLKADGYGTLNLARSLFSVTLVFSPLGLDVALQRHVGRSDPAQTRLAAEILLSRFVTMGLSGLVVLALVAGGATLLERHVFKHPGFGATLLLTMLALPFATDMAVMGGAYRGLYRPIPSLVATQMVQPTARIILILALFGSLGGFLATLYGTLGSYVLSWAALALLFRRDLPVAAQPMRPALSGTRQIFRYAPTLGLAFLAATVARSLDTITLGYWHDISDVGRYGIVLMVSQLVAMVGSSLGQTIGPRITAAIEAGEPDKSLGMLRDTMVLSSLVTAPLCVAISVWGSDIDLLLGPTYHIPRVVFALAAGSQLVFTILQHGGWPLVATGRQSWELLSTVVALVAQLVACLVLVPPLGLVGAGAATMIMALTLGLSRFVMLRRMFEGPILDVRIFLPIAISLTLAAPLALLGSVLGFRAWWLTGLLTALHVGLSVVASVKFVLGGSLFDLRKRALGR